jgi:hypothetical protein
MCVSTSSPAFMASPSANASRVVEWAYLLQCSLFSSLQAVSSTATSTPTQQRFATGRGVAGEQHVDYGPQPEAIRLLGRVVADLGGLHPKPRQVQEDARGDSAGYDLVGRRGELAELAVASASYVE